MLCDCDIYGFVANAKRHSKGDVKMSLSIKVCWMYHDIMDLYGDKGNMMVLKKRCEDRDIDFVLDTLWYWREKKIYVIIT